MSVADHDVCLQAEETVSLGTVLETVAGGSWQHGEQHSVLVRGHLGKAEFGCCTIHEVAVDGLDLTWDLVLGQNY